MNLNNVLFVDDDENILSGYTRNFRNKYTVTAFSSPLKALNHIMSGNSFSVVVSDYRMPEMNGVQFLNEVKQKSPDTVRIMLTGYADINTAIDSVNEGNIFRFLTKPCPPEKLMPHLESGLEQFRLITSERELLEKTLKGSIKLLIELISSSHQYLSEKSIRLKKIISNLAAHQPYEIRWQAEIAALLSQIGCITLPEELLKKVKNQQMLTRQENDLYNTHPTIGAGLLRNIPRLEIVAEAISYQLAGGIPGSIDADRKIAEVFQVAKLLRSALALDEANQKEVQKDVTFYQNLKAINESANQKHVTLDERRVISRLTAGELREGMLLGQDIVVDDVLLLTSGHELNSFNIQKLKNFVQLDKLKNYFIVIEKVNAVH